MRLLRCRRLCGRTAVKGRACRGACSCRRRPCFAVGAVCAVMISRMFTVQDTLQGEAPRCKLASSVRMCAVVIWTPQ